MERTPLLVAAAKNLRRKRLPRGQTLLYQNDLMSNIFILTKGVIKIYDIDDDGNEKILHLLSAYGVLPCRLRFSRASNRGFAGFMRL